MSDAARSDGGLFDQDVAREAEGGGTAASTHDALSDPEIATDAAKPASVPARAGAPRGEPLGPNLGKLIPLYLPADEGLFRASAGDLGGAARERNPKPSASVRAPRDWSRLRGAASLAAVVAIGLAAGAEHVHALRVTGAEQARSSSMAHRLNAMSTRLEALESNRSRDELASLRKVLAEIKSGAASTRDVGGAVGQLASRVERLEKDQGARLDKLGDRIDRDAAARLADITARLDKLEARAVAAAPKTVVAKAAPGVSYEPTGAIDRPPPTLHRFRLAQIRNGYAMIDSPAGEFVVAPGDMVPGGGRVLRIERHGRDWTVVTTQGQIVAADD